MKSFFPWRLYWKFFFNFLVFSNLSLVLTWALLLWIFDVDFFSESSVLGFIFFLGFSIIGAAWFSYRFSAPLRGIILKALRISNRRRNSESADLRDVLEEESEEYFELELALEKIRKKLKWRRLQLSQEREETKALMSSIEDAILSVDLHEKVKFFNSPFALQFLRRHGNSSSGSDLTLSNLFREPEILDIVRRALSTGAPSSTTMALTTALSSQIHYFSIKVSVLRAERTRAVYGALILFHDITDLKKAEKIRIEFVENASHELRTPMTSIKGFVETMKEDVEQGRLEQVGYFLGIISRSVDRLTDLVNDMMTLVSLDSVSELKPEVFNPAELTTEVLQEISTLAQEKNIEIHSQCEVNSMRADAKKVAQVLRNLLGNAIKYIPSHGEVQVHWERLHGKVRLSVKDNGPGIAEEHLPRLFERFYRIDKSRSRDVGGTGLGLAIVKHIVQSHGGTVHVHSRLGEGTEFICYFPA